MSGHLLRALGRVNEAHPWSHNNGYAPFVLYQAWRAKRAGAVSGLDIGCGTGDLLRRLARVLPDVVGLEPDPATARAAIESTRRLPNVRVVTSSFPTGEPRTFDFVSLVAVLHHLPLEDGIRGVRAALNPGGRLVIVGCYREETPSDFRLALVSLLLNPLIGLVVHPRRAATLPDNMSAPVAPPSESYARTREALQTSLPGVAVRRGLFWRYTAVWVAPTGSLGGRRPGCDQPPEPVRPGGRHEHDRQEEHQVDQLEP